MRRRAPEGGRKPKGTRPVGPHSRRLGSSVGARPFGGDASGSGSGSGPEGSAAARGSRAPPPAPGLPPNRWVRLIFKRQTTSQGRAAHGGGAQRSLSPSPTPTVPDRRPRRASASRSGDPETTVGSRPHAAECRPIRVGNAIVPRKARKRRAWGAGEDENGRLSRLASRPHVDRLPGVDKWAADLVVVVCSAAGEAQAASQRHREGSSADAKAQHELLGGRGAARSAQSPTGRQEHPSKGARSPTARPKRSSISGPALGPLSRAF